MQRPLYVVPAFVLLCMTSCAFGQVEAPLFAQPVHEHEPLKITLQTDLRALLNDRGDERDEHAATMLFVEGDSTVVTQEVQLEVRGNFRRQVQHCSFPPLRLNVKKKQVEGTMFEGQDKLKLVNICQRGNSKFENYLMLEYLVYRMYNVLTEFSFRVRLLEVTFEDTRRNRDYTAYSFLIEDDEAMATRNGGKITEMENNHQESMNIDQVAVMALFQYMIGNSDWSVPGLHNMDLVRVGEEFRPYPVPYDFDFSGFVNAPYAQPPDQLPINKVTERFYKGYCRTEEELNQTISLFQEKRGSVMTLVETFPYLDRRPKRTALRFLDDFFGTLDSQRRVRRVFMDQCL